MHENQSPATQNSLQAEPRPPVRWLRPLKEYGVILYTEHQTCYTPGSNLREYLKRQHNTKSLLAKEITSWVALQNLVAEITLPVDNSLLIHSLKHHIGFLCTATESYHFRVASEDKMQWHCSKQHNVDIRRKQKERAMYRKVIL